MPDKLWAGRAAKDVDEVAAKLNASIGFDSRMYFEDIEGSMAHAAMLGAKGVISREDADAILEGLGKILDDIDSGALKIDETCEDIHTFVEAELTARIGEAGKRLHTARSRNDQVATDLRLYLRTKTEDVVGLIKAVAAVLCDRAVECKAMVMPGYTHLQRAQPVTFGHHLMAYAVMLSRDVGRLEDASKRMNESPLGACALAGTSYPTDRRMTAASLGFDGPALNSMDAVSDRDFCVELLSALALLMAHLSRMAEELILWSSWEFKFIELDDSFTTGSSIMPQKKNPDMAELIRGKTGRVYGDLVTMLTVLKGLPLAYNKDMQEDKEAVFDAFDTVEACLTVLAPMLKTMEPLPANMRKAASAGFINATDLADWLTGHGMPFRTAYKLVGGLVAECVASGETLESLPMEKYKSIDPIFDESLYEAIDMDNIVARRRSLGAACPDSVLAQAEQVRKILGI